MKLVITSVKDALKGYSTFNLTNNVAIAKRDFHDAVNNTDIIKNHLPDYSLYKLGEFDTETGEITPCVELLTSASDEREA